MKTLGHGDCEGQAAGIQEPGAHRDGEALPYVHTDCHTLPHRARDPHSMPPPPFPTAFVPRRYIQKHVGDTIPYDPL